MIIFIAYSNVLEVKIRKIEKIRKIIYAIRQKLILFDLTIRFFTIRSKSTYPKMVRGLNTWSDFLTKKLCSILENIYINVHTLVPISFTVNW